jgi:hypothetical protein
VEVVVQPDRVVPECLGEHRDLDRLGPLLLGAKLLEVTDIAGGSQMKMEFSFEVDGASKPSCVAEVLFRVYS